MKAGDSSVTTRSVGVCLKAMTSFPHAQALRIAAVATVSASIALAAGTATAERPRTTRNRGFSAEDARVFVAAAKKKKKGKRSKKRRGRKGRNSSGSLAPITECTIGTNDLIHEKIDVSAQVSMMRKMSGSAASRAEASSIYHAIEVGRLAGIYLPPRGVVSARGRMMSPQKGYWQLIPKGELSTCVVGPDGEAPMIVYRENLAPSQIDAAISSAWKSCGLPQVTHQCTYDRNLERPPEKESECESDDDCLAIPGAGNKCNLETNTCFHEFGPGHIDTCEQPRCTPGIPATVDPQCGMTVTRELRECLPVPGEVCGVCENAGKGASACHKQNERKHHAEIRKCKDEHSPAKTAGYTAKCLAQMAKCVDGSPIACAKSAQCMVDPKPVKEYRDCLNRESQRYQERSQECIRE